MPGDSHTKGDKKGDFCSKRAETCSCGEKYRVPCNGDAAEWDKATPSSAKFPASKYPQRYGTGVRLRGHEAHHILCVASVTGQITTNAEIDKIVFVTTWCVNKPLNMIGLPRFEHTITWYVDLETGNMRSVVVNGKDVLSVDAPPFKDLAQHDYDHDEYIKEIDEELIKIVAKVKKAVSPPVHKDPTGNLAGELNDIIGDWKSQLQTADTHGSWQKGMDGDTEWYLPFSMAKNATRRDFPLGDNPMMEKISDVMAAYSKLP